MTTLNEAGAHGLTTHLLVGGKAATSIFALMLIGFVVESELTQYVQTNLDYRHPYFLFYVAHSSMLIILPLHLLFLYASTANTPIAYLRGLSLTVQSHLSRKTIVQTIDGGSFPTLKFLLLVSLCTIGITIPGLLWFAAISLASVSDVTAIWNSNAFWAYVLSVKIQKLPWQPRRLGAVVVASIGVLAVVYGSGSPSDSPTSENIIASRVGDGSERPRAPFLGNSLTLIASLGYALYQVMYKLYAALPTDVDPDASENEWRRSSYTQISIDDIPVVSSMDALANITATDDGAVYPAPFGLYANLLTSCLGLMTLCVLWIPLPILHYMQIESFELPNDPWLLFFVMGIALSGVTFYMCFMILLGLWGPIITSVGNLLTIVLVLITDTIFGNAFETLTFWSLLGSGMIVCAFAVLAYETFNT